MRSERGFKECELRAAVNTLVLSSSGERVPSRDAMHCTVMACSCETKVRKKMYEPHAGSPVFSPALDLTH